MNSQVWPRCSSEDGVCEVDILLMTLMNGGNYEKLKCSLNFHGGASGKGAGSLYSCLQTEKGKEILDIHTKFRSKTWDGQLRTLNLTKEEQIQVTHYILTLSYVFWVE